MRGLARSTAPESEDLIEWFSEIHRLVDEARERFEAGELRPTLASLAAVGPVHRQRLWWPAERWAPRDRRRQLDASRPLPLNRHDLLHWCPRRLLSRRSRRRRDHMAFHWVVGRDPSDSWSDCVGDEPRDETSPHPIVRNPGPRGAILINPRGESCENLRLGAKITTTRWGATREEESRPAVGLRYLILGARSPKVSLDRADHLIEVRASRRHHHDWRIETLQGSENVDLRHALMATGLR
jgi:hypothetical protein